MGEFEDSKCKNKIAITELSLMDSFQDDFIY